MQLHVTMENLGPVDAPGNTLYAYVNGDVAPLGAGQTTQINLTWAFPPTGEYLVHLGPDGDGRGPPSPKTAPNPWRRS